VACSGADDVATSDTITGTTASTTNTSVSTSGTTASTATTSAGSGSESDSSSGTSVGTSTTTASTGTTDPTASTGTTGTSGTTGTTDGLTSTSSTTDMGSTTDAPCPMGTILCENGVAKTCDGMGGYSSQDTCKDECLDGVGCVLCVPGSYKCNGDVSQQCADDGMSWKDLETCDAIQGVMCDANAGQCVGACAPATLGLSYIGCDYYPTVTANIVATNFNFAVVVANTSANSANIRIDKGAMQVLTDTVAANSVKVIKLPWVNQLKVDQNASSALTVDGAYRLRSNQPVTVYQYNPLEYSLGGSNSYTNDASLLLPVNTWTGDYFVAARNSWYWSGGVDYPGLYAVTASADGTTVTLAPGTTGKTVKAGGGVAANGTGVISMNQGDVLQVFSAGNGPNPAPSQSDLSGTHITADKPIQVIGGHMCTFIPHNIGYCDHLEESIVPFEALAKEYLVTPPLIPTGGNTPKAQMVRIVATTDGTTLTYDPPQAGAPAAIAKAGDYVEVVQNNKDFKITANFKVVVSQYMLGQDAGGNSGDPAMTLAVGVDQYRNDYLFHAPTNYEKNFVNITAPMGANVTLDGAAVGGFVAIGATGFGVARVQLSNAGDGNHRVMSDQAVGISVYGYGQYTSFWYPGGLNLDLIPQ
ncbi:MAG TPA: IgGFc-binding protein, partial [Nannocystaceae bacterium]|nr:IgGFc-binding protein [Nannocystaceae bacterium]